MFSTDDCEGGPYFAETGEGHSDAETGEGHSDKRKTLISFTCYPSSYSECVIVRAVGGAFDQPNYV